MSMNIYRLTGDVSHVISILLLLKLVCVHKDGMGLSFRSQEIFLLTFLARYLDLFTTFYSIYNWLVKVFYISTTALLLHRIQKKNEDGSCMQDKATDIFPHVSYLVLPSFLPAFLVHYMGNGAINFDVLEFLWTFSVCLESVAIVPQLVLLQKYRKIQPLLARAILCMGLYRVLYILNWIYRAHTEKGYQHHWLAYIAGVIQTLLYADFFYSYMVKCRANGDCSPPPADDEGEQTEEPEHGDDQLTYNPILQDLVCCCNHTAKNEEQTKPDDAMNNDSSDDSNTGVSQKTSQTASAPPMLIFVGSPCAVLLRVLLVVVVSVGITTLINAPDWFAIFLIVSTGGVYVRKFLFSNILFSNSPNMEVSDIGEKTQENGDPLACGTAMETPLLQASDLPSTPVVIDASAVVAEEGGNKMSEEQN